jgi:hypothetical protein
MTVGPSWRTAPAGRLEFSRVVETPEQAFAEVASACGELLSVASGGEPERWPILLAGPDRSALLAEFVEDLVFLAEKEGFAVRKLERLELTDASLRAAVSGLSSCEEPRLRPREAWIQGRTSGNWQVRVVIEAVPRTRRQPP